jgi:copper homeostasis protein
MLSARSAKCGSGDRRRKAVICEICVDSVAGVRIAKAAGADRVEVCADLLEGGITPSLGMIRAGRAVDGIRLHVMIRPRGGDFLFDDDEFSVMQTDIDMAKAERADGVVIGLLRADGTIDAERTQELVARARPLAVTFHRAFDMAPDPFEALEALVALGVERVLTSGQEASVLEGLPLIEDLIRRAGDRIIVMPGGGITARNVERIASVAGLKEIHFAALEPEAGGMRFRRPHVFMGGELRPPEYERPVTSSPTLRSIMRRATGRPVQT